MLRPFLFCFRPLTIGHRHPISHPSITSHACEEGDMATDTATTHATTTATSHQFQAEVQLLAEMRLLVYQVEVQLQVDQAEVQLQVDQAEVELQVDQAEVQLRELPTKDLLDSSS